MSAEQVLHTELETYERLRPSLAAEEGRWATVHGERLVGVFDSYALALQAGYTAARLRPFLVKKIAMQEVPTLITRLAIPCPS